MDLSPTDRARWPLWLPAVLVAVAFGAAWWQPWRSAPDLPPPAAVAAAPRPPAPDLPAPAPVAPARPAPVAARAAPDLRLVGTVAAGAGSFATVLRAGDAQLLQVRVGDRIDGLAVTSIQAGRVVLAGPAQAVVIRAEAAPAPDPAPASADGAAPAAPPAWDEGKAPWDLVPPFGH